MFAELFASQRCSYWEWRHCMNRQPPRQNWKRPILNIGFIKLTDCAPIVIAKELNFFEDEGLYVTIEVQSNWKILLDRVITGELDGAHLLAGQPIAATIGFAAITDYEIWKDNPEKVVGVTADWAAKNPNTHVAVVKA